MSAPPGPARARFLAVGCALALLLPLVLPAGATSQNPPPQNPPVQDPQTGQRPIFRGGTDVVRVDVFPRRDGRIVTGLTREDFQVFENDTPQTIETFEYVAIEREGEPVDPRDAREAQRMAADARSRVFVFYLDTFYVTMEGSARAREPLLEFLRHGLGPRDLFAVMTPKQDPALLEFGRATENAAGYMTITKPWGVMDSPVTDPFELKLEACAPGDPGRPGPAVVGWRWAMVMADLEGLIAYLGALRPERKNLVIVSERWQSNIPVFRNESFASPSFKMAPQMGGRARGSFELPKAVTDAEEFCRKAREAATGIRGENRRRSLIDLARDANVALYFISPAPQNFFTAMTMAKEMADRTDGLNLVSNDFYGGLERLLEHQSGYYMLGYRSTHGPTGDRPREIRVRTSRRGVDLDVRRLYRTPTAEELSRSAAPPAAKPRTDVELASETLGRIRDDVEVFVRAVPAGDAADITVELSTNAIRSRWRGGADITLILRDSTGAELSTTAAIPAGARSAQVRSSWPAAPGPVRATVRLSRGSTTASEFTDIQLDPRAAFGPAALFRAGSLPKQPFVPAADVQFDRVERLRLEWPVRGTLASPAVRVRNARGEERPADITISEIDDGARRLRADMRLISLAAGDYVVEATARVDDQDVKQLLAIRIIR